MPIFLSNIEAGRDVLIALSGSKITVFGESDLPTLAQPRLQRFRLHDARDEHGFDLFRTLRWDYGLTKSLYGREGELSEILRFARSGGMAAEGRILCGDGGIGKTRLAAEAATCLAEEGWTAGFIPSDFRERPFRLTGRNGLFLILDYPEERPEDTEFLIRLIADLVEAPCKIRVLFLSRHNFTSWEDMAVRCEGRLGRQELGALQALEPGDCLALVEEAISNFSATFGFPLSVLPDPRPWIEESPHHRSPLFLAAASVHAVLDPAKAFGLSGRDILRSLAAREKRRVDHVSVAQKLGRNGLGRVDGFEDDETEG